LLVTGAYFLAHGIYIHSLYRVVLACVELVCGLYMLYLATTKLIQELSSRRQKRREASDNSAEGSSADAGDSP
jgi:hypothetical protein